MISYKFIVFILTFSVNALLIGIHMRVYQQKTPLIFLSIHSTEFHPSKFYQHCKYTLTPWVVDVDNNYTNRTPNRLGGARIRAYMVELISKRPGCDKRYYISRWGSLKLE